MNKPLYFGIFFVSLATLMNELFLTRIFSVTVFYHFAFVAISLAMFGMTVGALIVYLYPKYFAREGVHDQLTINSIFLSISIVLSLFIYLKIPFSMDSSFSLASLASNSFIYAIIACPFIFSGICVCLTLTRFPEKVGKLYAADLFGAAGGCLLFNYLMNAIGGTTVAFIVAFVSVIGALCFAAAASNKLKFVARICFLIILVLTFADISMSSKGTPLMPIKWVKGTIEPHLLYDKWNSFSRIRVMGNPDKLATPFGWGLSPVYPYNHKVKQLQLDIDGFALTTLTGFDGNLAPIDFLKYDVTNFAHYLKPKADVLVIGTGGGRDILSALVFKQKSIVGIELNKAIINAVNVKFGNFTGHLDQYPSVRFVNDEARSWLTRTNNKFDIIEVSLIDTYASTAAGAYVLSENSLYTVEAWKIFLNHLNKNGILSFSRWHIGSPPAEIYRLTTLAGAALSSLGVKTPRNNMIIVKSGNVATLLVSRDPFSFADLILAKKVTDRMRFELLFDRNTAVNNFFPALASEASAKRLLPNLPLNLSAPTDDNPFFFNMMKLHSLFFSKYEHFMGNWKVVVILGQLLIVMLILSFACILLPLFQLKLSHQLKDFLPLLSFFGCIGFGFMLIELSQMQRLIILLGHPTYSLTVVLFSLLLSSGLGSYLTHHIKNPILFLSFLLIVLFSFGSLTPPMVGYFAGASTPLRILIATGILFPLGIFLGMAFPFGLKIAAEKAPDLPPWLWGVNGATSVCASVLATIISLIWGISISFWLGFFFYVLAFLAYIRATRSFI
ncbi:MAG: hypothetical protein ABIH50_02790 [bacterium]